MRAWLHGLACRVRLHKWVVYEKTPHPILASFYITGRCAHCGTRFAEFVPMDRLERRLLVGTPRFPR